MIAILLLLLIGCRPYEADVLSQESKRLEVPVSQILDKIETDEFFLPTHVASGHNVVESILKGSQEVIALAASYPASEQLIRERAKLLIKNPAGQQKPLIAYAIVFKLKMDSHAVPILTQYLRSIPDSEASDVKSPWHPFKYVVDALTTITQGKVKAPDKGTFQARQTIAEGADRWYHSTVAIPKEK